MQGAVRQGIEEAAVNALKSDAKDVELPIFAGPHWLVLSLKSSLHTGIQSPVLLTPVCLRISKPLCLFACSAMSEGMAFGAEAVGVDERRGGG